MQSLDIFVMSEIVIYAQRALSTASVAVFLFVRFGIQFDQQCTPDLLIPFSIDPNVLLIY
jgi:hypothetical protein